jgi:hypothetical protein
MVTRAPTAKPNRTIGRSGLIGMSLTYLNGCESGDGINSGLLELRID